MATRAVPLLGLMLLAAGFVWFFHGVGVIENGAMSGDPGSAVLGAALVVIGIGLLGRARASRG
jgi:hypothetical protein